MTPNQQSNNKLDVNNTTIDQPIIQVEPTNPSKPIMQQLENEVHFTSKIVQSQVQPSLDQTKSKTESGIKNPLSSGAQQLNNELPGIVSGSFMSEEELKKIEEDQIKQQAIGSVLSSRLLNIFDVNKNRKVFIGIICIILLMGGGSTLFALSASSIFNPVGYNHDKKVIADLKTIDNGIIKYVYVNKDTFPNNNNTTSCSDISTNINSMNIGKTNYSLNNYQVTDLSTLDDDCDDTVYNICTTFDTNTWHTKSSSQNEPYENYSAHGKGLWCFIMDNTAAPYSSPSGTVSLSPSALAKVNQSSITSQSNPDYNPVADTPQANPDAYNGTTDTVSGTKLVSEYNSSYATLAESLGVSSTTTKSCTNTGQTSSNGANVYDCTVSNTTGTFTLTTNQAQAEALMLKFVSATQSLDYTQGYQVNFLLPTTEVATGSAAFDDQATLGDCSTEVAYYSQPTGNTTFSLSCEASNLTSVPPGFTLIPTT